MSAYPVVLKRKHSSQHNILAKTIVTKEMEQKRRLFQRLSLPWYRQSINRRNLRPAFQIVQIVCPSLHHQTAIIDKGSAIIGASVRIPHGMSQLVLNQVNAEPRNFIQNRSSSRPEPVTGYRLSVETKVPERCIDAVIAHGA